MHRLKRTEVEDEKKRVLEVTRLSEDREGLDAKEHPCQSSFLDEKPLNKRNFQLFVFKRL